MRATPTGLADVLAESHTVSATVDVYYDGRPTVVDVPVVSGTWTQDTTQHVPEQVTVEVPATLLHDDGTTTDLVPGRDGSPVDCTGHRLLVSYQVDLPGGDLARVPLGWARVQSWEQTVSGTVRLDGVGLAQALADYRPTTPLVVPTGTAYADALLRIVAAQLPVAHAAHTVRPGTTLSQIDVGDDRLAALAQLMTPWHCRWWVDASAVVQVAPEWDDTTDPVVGTLTDGEAGTVVYSPRSGTRDGIYNAVIVTGEDTGDQAPVQGAAYQATGPYAWWGPFGNVPYFYSSPLLSTPAEAALAARTRLDALMRRAREVTVEAVPDPRIEPGDVLSVVYDGQTVTVRVDAVSVPLSADGGTMALTGHVLDGR